MLMGSEDCARTPPAARLVEPEPSPPRSIRTTSCTPASAMWNAALTPITPPPTITTLAESGRMPGEEISNRARGVRLIPRLPVDLPRHLVYAASGEYQAAVDATSFLHSAQSRYLGALRLPQ